MCGASPVQLVSTMSLRESGRTTLTPRLLRHFNVVAVNDFDDTTIHSIFSKVYLVNLYTVFKPDKDKKKALILLHKENIRLNVNSIDLRK